MKKKQITAYFSLLFLLLVWLFCGFFESSEFAGEWHFFVKYKPTFKLIFYSPVGESDMKLADLTPEQRIEERYFEEYVKGRQKW